MRQVLYTTFMSNIYHIHSYIYIYIYIHIPTVSLVAKKNLVKHWKVSKYYESDCRSFGVWNNCNSFHNDMENIKYNLIKNAYPPLLIDKVIKKYLDYKFSSNKNQLKDTSDVHYFKLPIGNFSHHIKNKLLKLCKEFCKENFNIKLVINSFKIKNYLSYKYPIPDVVQAILAKPVFTLKLGLMSISKTITILIFLTSTLHRNMLWLTYSLCFKIIDRANSKLDLKVKEALHIIHVLRNSYDLYKYL